MNIKMKLISLIAILFIGVVTSAQNLNTNQEKAIFMGKCYAMGVAVAVSDKESPPSDIAKVKKWAVNVNSAALNFTTQQEFDSISKGEMERIKQGGRNYLMSQAQICTKILGSW